MDNDTVEKLISAGMDGAEVHVDGDGRHFEAIVICDAFEGKNRVKRHQMVYKVVGDNLNDDAIHALALRTYTKQQWSEQAKGQ